MSLQYLPKSAIMLGSAKQNERMPEKTYQENKRLHLQTNSLDNTHTPNTRNWQVQNRKNWKRRWEETKVIIHAGLDIQLQI